MDPANTWEVPREQWAAFLAGVEALQRDQPVELELIGPEIERMGYEEAIRRSMVFLDSL